MRRLSWKGNYLDGKTAGKSSVDVRFSETGLIISHSEGPNAGREVLWPYPEILQVQGFYRGEPVRLERGTDFPEILIVEDSDFLSDLRLFSPKAAGRFHNPAFRAVRVRYTVLAAIAIVVVLGLLYYRGIPWMAALITPHVSMEWEKGLGRSALGLVAPEGKRCGNPELKQAIDRITATLAASQPDLPYRFNVVVVENPIVNAMALPGGSIIIFSGLLKKTESPEELAGVLAHEMQHVILRHATKRIIADFSISALLAVITGDVTGAAAYGLQAARTIAVLRYSRSDEEEADREGMKMILAAGIDPRGMLHFFDTLEKQQKGVEIPKYLSTHPDTADRIVKLKQLAGLPSPSNHTHLFDKKDWDCIRFMCSENRKENR